MKCIIPKTIPRDADISQEALGYQKEHAFDSVRVRPTWGGWLLVGIKSGKEVWK